jgi:hypothetical protein
MSTHDFERVGAFVYGTQRLDSVLSSLTGWLARTKSNIVPSSPDEKFNERAAVATAFFGESTNYDESRAQYFQILSKFRTLEKDLADFIRSGNLDGGLDARLAETRNLHFALAQVIEKLGYPEINPTILREQAVRI